MWCKHCQLDSPVVGPIGRPVTCNCCHRELLVEPMSRKSYRWPTEASEYSIWHPDEARSPQKSNAIPEGPTDRLEVGGLDVGWTTAGWIDRPVSDSSSSARWRVDPPVSGPVPGNSSPSRARLEQESDRSISGRVAMPQSSYRYIDPAHYSPMSQSISAKSNPTGGWWCFLLSIHLVLIGALWLIVDQWIARQTAATIQRALVFSLYTVGQLLALGCLGYLMLQLQRNWQKTQRVLRTLTRHVNLLLDMRRLPHKLPDQDVGASPTQVNANEQTPSLEEAWRKTSRAVR